MATLLPYLIPLFTRLIRTLRNALGGIFTRTDSSIPTINSTAGSKLATTSFTKLKSSISCATSPAPFANLVASEINSSIDSRLRSNRSTSFGSTSSGNNSKAKRIRAKGVLKSWEMPANKVVRFSRRRETSLAMVLKLRARETNSLGPASGKGSISRIPRKASACLATLTKGRAIL